MAHGFKDAMNKITFINNERYLTDKQKRRQLNVIKRKWISWICDETKEKFYYNLTDEEKTCLITIIDAIMFLRR